MSLGELFGQYVEYTDKARKATPTVIELIWERYGKANAINGKQIISEVQRIKNIKLAGSEVRQIIAFIRHDGIAPNLVASGKGYYRTKDRKELQTYIESLQGRVSAIAHIRDVVQEYLNTLPTAA